MSIGLALSGGGFRATLYHLGVVRFLRDANLLESVSHITSVSGGSVLAAHLVLNWDRYCGDSNDFDSAAHELLDFVRLDVRNRILRRYPFIVAANAVRRLSLTRHGRPQTRTMLLERHYERHLFGDTCLYELPKAPELHILCTNLSGGGLSSFTRDGLLLEERAGNGESAMKLHHVGLATVPMAVAASSAFPGFFPPLELSAEMVGAADGKFRTQYFTDGGVYDNLGVRMFHHINSQIERTRNQLEVVDVTAAMTAWNHAAQHQDATPLGRLAEIYKQRTGRGHSTLLEEPARFVEGLHELAAGAELHRDASLQCLLEGDPLNGSGGEGIPYEDRMLRNLELMQQAFQQVSGQEVIQLNGQSFDAILASDAGKKIQVSGSERMGGFLGTALRSSDILMDRVWQLEQEHVRNTKGVVFFPITRIVQQEEDPSALHHEVQFQVSRIRTDMDRFSELEVSGLIRHGYGVARQTLAVHPKFGSSVPPERSQWDPTSHSSLHTARPGDRKSRRGAAAISETNEARKLQASAHRRYMGLITAPGDWVTHLYIPIILLLFGVLPWMGWRFYRHVHTNAMLSGAITQSRQDYDHLLGMLENGPVAPWEPIDFIETDKPSPLFAERGLDMISDARITDLRNWRPTPPGGPMAADSLVYVCRHVSVRKVANVEGTTALEMQSLWNYPDVLIRCNNPELKPVLRRYKLDDTKQANAYRWEVQLDFSKIKIGETVHLTVEAIVRNDENKPNFDHRDWWRFEVDGDPEMAAVWVLLPESRSYTDFHLVQYNRSTDRRETVVQPTRMSVIRHGTILNWGVVNPEAGLTYSCRWKRDL